MLRPRKAQRGTEKRSVDRTSLSCAWLGLPTSRFTTREAPHKQNYDQGYPDLGLATPKSRPGYPDLGLATGI